jgi:RimJ/RimL family protein N-acetyltransferase
MQPTIVVRISAIDDLPEINRIRLHPLVRAQQLGFLRDHDRNWKHWMEQNARVGDIWFRSSTIISDERIIGYVNQTLYFADQCSFAECGWNLDPAYWGRGIMRIALQVILQWLFAEQNMSCVIADCFRNNTRCKRLLSKLHFSPVELPFVERIRMAFHFRCLHWIERYRIDRGTWDRTPENAATKKR